jgi:type VI secretion system protein ImpA
VPLRDDLLQPVAGENPSGPSLRYERVYDQIKEARTEEDDSLPAGDWQRAAKKADFAVVIKLAGEALATKSKDLQLLAWLTEAHVKREGIKLLPACLSLFIAMQEQFWDTLHPEIEDGDSGLRAMPVEWMANRTGALLYSAPLTRAGYGFYQYKESRSDASQSDAKRAARERGVAEGKLTAEAFDAAWAATPKSFYVETENALDESMELVHRLAEFCEERYGADGPSLSRLEQAIQEVRQVLASLLSEKRKTEPDASAAVASDIQPDDQVDTVLEAPRSAAAAEPERRETGGEPQATGRAAAQVPTPVGAPGGTPVREAAEPADAQQAAARIQACACFLAQLDEASPVAYLLQTGLRWGELRARQGTMDADYPPPPPTEARQQLRRALTDGNWSELLRASIAAAGEPWGGAWLDLQRYICKASVELGHPAIAAAVLSSLGALLHDFPAIPGWTFSDDTPTANPETLRWITETVLPQPVEAPPPAAELVYTPHGQIQQGQTPHEHAPQELLSPRAERGAEGEQQEAVPDTLEIARGLIRQGRPQQAIQLLVRDAAQQESGRLRFQRKTQVAQLCLAAGYDAVAAPMLEQLAAEVEQRKLEGWESSDLLAPPLTLLLKCMQARGDAESRRQEIFERLCRIDPTAAIECSS